jgi:hypothetical protein
MTIEELEAALAERDARIAGLEAELARHRPPPPPAATRLGPYVAPSADQYRRLLAVVHAAFPQIERVEFRDKLDDFIKAFRFVATCHRTGVIDTRYDKTWWCDQAGTTLPSLMAAIIAAGDVMFCSLDRYPWDLGWDLLIGHRAGSRAATNAWLVTLDGVIRPAVPLVRPKMSESREVRSEMVRQLGGGGW